MKVLSKQEMDWLVSQAYLMMQYQHLDKALVLLDALLAIQPSLISARRLMMGACLEAGQAKKALEMAHQLLSISTEKQDIAALWLCISRACWRLQQPQKARAAYQRYLGFSQVGNNDHKGLQAS